MTLLLAAVLASAQSCAPFVDRGIGTEGDCFTHEGATIGYVDGGVVAYLPNDTVWVVTGGPDSFASNAPDRVLVHADRYYYERVSAQIVITDKRPVLVGTSYKTLESSTYIPSAGEPRCVEGRWSIGHGGFAEYAGVCAAHTSFVAHPMPDWERWTPDWTPTPWLKSPIVPESQRMHFPAWR